MLFGLFTKNKHIETEEEKQSRINKKLYGDLTPEQYWKKHDREAHPSSKLWSARNQILEILRENNLHIELGSDCIAGIGLWLCENEDIKYRNTRTDASLTHYMELHHAEAYLQNNSKNWYYSNN